MLELRPNCECCDKDLPSNSLEACICSYECTFCRSCVDQILKNVCPNCAGGFTARPIRPVTDRREGVSLQYQPASIKRVHSRYDEESLISFANQWRHIPPETR